MTWKTPVPTQNQFRRIFFFWRLSPREQSRGNIARAIVYLTNPADSFDRRAKESRNTQQASCTYAGWLARNPPPPPFFLFLLFTPPVKNIRVSRYSRLEGCIPTWWKQDEDDDVEAASTHTTFYGSTGPFFHRAAMMEMPKRMCTQYSNLVGKSNATRSLALSLPSSIPHLIGIHIQRCTPKVGRQDKEN